VGEASGRGGQGDPRADLTGLLRGVAGGEPGAADRFLPLIYDQLKAIARQRMGAERPGHTLQATALVHEAYLRVIGDQPIAWNGRAHFFHVAAEAMRRLLIEHARARGRVKRGGERTRVPLSVVDLAEEQDEAQIMALDDALRRLEGVDAQAAEVVRLRFYAGLGVEETAAALGCSARTVKRDWAFARAWLHRALGERAGEERADA
jgi:RNA polymerase sigma factor (TIGR02999 family)